MALPDFDVAYKLGEPSSRTPRSTEAELRAAFPGESPIRFLGSGAFGETWRVGDSAVKVIVADTVDEARIAREITAASISNPHVVSLRETRTIFAAGEDRVSLVFGYVSGWDLASAIGEHGPFPVDELYALAVGLLRGLAAIRSAGVIHRDIKPENVQLRSKRAANPVILDLGLAYVAEDASLTEYPAALGTRAYMPPEVLRGDRAVHRSDMYALGVTLHIAATGNHPFFKEGEVVKRSEAVPRIERGAQLELDDQTLASVVVEMLNPQAYRRPTAARALKKLMP